MQEVEALGIPAVRILEFGTCEEGAYSLQTWIEGRDAEEIIPKLSGREIYDYGWQAGQILKKIHSIPAPADIPDWETFFNSKIDRKLKMYDKCPLKYENGDVFIEFIQANRHLLKNRPQTYQHGDYHIGNLMIDNNGQLVVIDFNRRDYGDPWEEFNRIVWCAQSNPLFASGMVDGYFNGEVPMDFWNLLTLYICSNTLSSLPWAIPFGEEEITTMRNQAKDILEWYDDMKRTIPSWYRKPMQILYGTTNQAKLESMRRITKSLGLEIIGLKDLQKPLPIIDESGKNPLENARIKAKAYYDAFGMPVFSCDSGLYFEGLEESAQPGTHVRRVGEKELSDEEMIAYYSQLAKKHNDRLIGKYRNAICFIADEEHICTSMDESLDTESFLLVSTPHEKLVPGFPLDSLSVDIVSGKYYYDLEDHSVDQSAIEQGFRDFFAKALNKPENY